MILRTCAMDGIVSCEVRGNTQWSVQGVTHRLHDEFRSAHAGTFLAARGRVPSCLAPGMLPWVAATGRRRSPHQEREARAGVLLGHDVCGAAE